ncbi:hypothetical protein L2E82_51888 [Cichorium intybus]|nr:hypothetical protein L2E82_51888 [Cichorium intybus]
MYSSSLNSSLPHRHHRLSLSSSIYSLDICSSSHWIFGVGHRFPSYFRRILTGLGLIRRCLMPQLVVGGYRRRLKLSGEIECKILIVIIFIFIFLKADGGGVDEACGCGVEEIVETVWT